jgi:hypothetical protein
MVMTLSAASPRQAPPAARGGASGSVSARAYRMFTVNSTMKILLAGLSPTTETTIRLIAPSVFRGASLHVLERDAPGSTPQQSVEALRCKLCIVDVQGLRWSPSYPEHQRRVELLLADRAAVLLFPPDSSGGWYDSPTFRNVANRILLCRPVSDEGIADAMYSAGAQAVHAETQAESSYLSSNIWLRKPNPPSPPIFAQRAGHTVRPERCRWKLQQQPNVKKNVFQCAVHALFA